MFLLAWHAFALPGLANALDNGKTREAAATVAAAAAALAVVVVVVIVVIYMVRIYPHDCYLKTITYF